MSKKKYKYETEIVEPTELYYFEKPKRKRVHVKVKNKKIAGGGYNLAMSKKRN